MSNERRERDGESGEERSGKLWGARAEFVASLGRKVADARDVMGSLEEDPTARSPRDELRRRLHALGSAARLLRFDVMARALHEADTVLERAARAGAMEDADFDALAQTLDDLPALAWSEPLPRESVKPAADDSASAIAPLAVSTLVFGGEDIAAALNGDDDGYDGRPFECERTCDTAAALDAARAIGPDLVVVDAETAGAADVVEALLDDPLTEPVPIVVLGEFPSQDSSARYIALGVAKTLMKPVAAAQLRRVCEELVELHDGRTIRVTLGEPTLEQLAERLADELRRALVDGVDGAARSTRVPLAEGTEVLGAVWGAIARVREVITARTAGAIRFAASGPEGAIALAPWLHGDALGAARATQGANRAPSPDVRLDGRRVLIADDDPGVTWFIGDLLRAAGCEVHEAMDGQAALDAAYRLAPELVVSDILMPGLDGFALTRALKRDVALRDTPIILLSWKEDLLQRVRELGAGAAAYLRKESDTRAILARVREVLKPRVRVEARLRGDGEVRGRLDGLTVHSLLEMVCKNRRSARVSVRDATFLYEIEIREGAPRRATRTAADGSFQRGERVIAAMLGIGAGRFVVAPSSASIQGDLSGTLAAQLAKPVAAARGALHVVTGASVVTVESLVLDDTILEGYLRATPEPTRDIVRRIANGASPRAMLLSGDVSPSMLEDLLADLATHGAVQAVRSVGGEDLLGAAIASAHAVLEGRAPVRSTPPVTPSKAPGPLSRPSWPSDDLVPASARSARPSAGRLPVRKTPGPPSRGVERDDDAGAPSSLADAVMRELVERGSEPALRASRRAPLVEPGSLRPRPPSQSPPDDRDDPPPPTLPPDAVIPSDAHEGDGVESVGRPTGPDVLETRTEEDVVVQDPSIPITEGTPQPSTAKPPNVDGAPAEGSPQTRKGGFLSFALSVIGGVPGAS